MLAAPTRNHHWRLYCALVGTMALAATMAVAPIRSAGAVAPGPLPVTPYSGFNATLTRAPYVTDLTKTTAYINWATTSNSPGSVQVAPIGSNGCPSSTITWSVAAQPLPVPKVVPYVASGSTSSTTTWQLSVTNGAGTSISEYQASVNVTGLAPGTQYCYSVFSTDKAGAVNLLPASQPDQTFTTLSPANGSSTTPVKFDVIDDTGENYASTVTSNGVNIAFPGGVNPDQASLYQQIGTSGAQFLLDAGDTAYNGGTQSNFGDLQQTGTLPEVSTMFGPSYFPKTGGIPTFDASGDHNQNTTTLKMWPTPTTVANSGGTYAYDSYTAANVDGITGSSPDDWYAFSTGNVRVYVIDGAWAEGSSGRLGTTTGSLCGPVGSSAAINCQPYQADADQHWQTSSPEYQWLAGDLAAHPGGVKFAVFQFPVRSDVTSQPSDLYTQNSSANPNASTSLEALLSQSGVDIAFNGHAHAYQRFVPQQPNQIISYDTGGGGGVLEPVQGLTGSTCQGLLATSDVYAIGWSPTAGTGTFCGPAALAASATPSSAAQVYSYLEVTVTGTSVTVTPKNAAGQAFDQQTYSFQHATDTQPPTTPTNVVATAASSSQVNLTWTPSTDNAGVTGYDIYRNGTYLTTTAGTVAGYSDTPVAPATTYQYTVDARDAAGNVSSPSTVASVTTPHPPSTPTLLQSAGSSTSTVTLQTPSTPGDLLVLSASLSTGATNRITNVMDPAGNTWKQAGYAYQSGHNSEGEMWYSANASSVSSVTVTTGAATMALGVQEFSGVATSSPLDVAAMASNTSTSASSGAATPTQTNELAVGFVGGHGNAEAIALTPGYTSQPQTNTGTTTSVVTGYQVLASTSTQSFGGAFKTAMYWAAGIAIFKPYG
jgi:hypothetical protein